MLPRNYKFWIVNNTGVTIEFSTDDANNSFTITARPWYFDTDGSLLYGTEQTFFADPTADMADGTALEAASAQDNSSNAWLGAHCTAALLTDAATAGTVEIYMEESTDGGTTWPSDANDFDVTDLTLVGIISTTDGDEDRSINFEL